MVDWPALRTRLSGAKILVGMGACLVLVVTASVTTGAFPGPCSDGLS